MSERITIKSLREKAYLTEEECVALLRCYYKEELLKEYLRQNKLNIHYLQSGRSRYYRSESVFKIFDTLRYTKGWRAVYADYLPER